MLEAHVPGDCYRILFANRKPIGVLQAKSAGEYVPVASAALPGALLDGALAVAGAVDVGMMTITAVAGVGPPASAVHPAVFVSLDLAPRLDTFLPQGSPLGAEASREFIRWLFPEGKRSRVPIAAVTGTNGKTTTSRMLYAMLGRSGCAPGLACTDGVYGSDNRLVREGDSSGGIAHWLLLSDPDLDSLVLETARGGVARDGILFDRCDVGVCTNVTVDHLGMRGLETLEQMVDLKRSIMARASGAVVLNADSTECLSMLPFREAEKTCLVSMKRSAEELREACGADGSCAVLEEVAGREWMVIYGDGGRMPLIAVNDAPSTFGGTARHNVANALHASLAACLLGVAIEEIKGVLSSFRMNFEETPGRLNIRDDLPFRVIMDYAHNADGFRQLCRFTDLQEVAGRRIVVFTLFGDRRDSDIIDAATEMAGHFDHYICRNYQDLRGGREREDIPALLRQALLGANVPAEAIEMIPDPAGAIEAGLSMAEERDLLVLLTDREEFRPTWDRVLKLSRPTE
jgi:cyanophycin synthetase